MTGPNKRRILIVEDEVALADSVRYNLEREGYEVLVSNDGAAGLLSARQDRPDLVILDLMIPSLHGFDVLRGIRSHSTVPVIILTAKDAEADKVAGLELGADDYVTKPFSIRELISRVRAGLRRAGLSPVAEIDEVEVLIGGPVELDIDRHVATVRDVEVPLRPKEFSLLEVLLRRKGRLVIRDDLIAEVWGYDYFGDTKTLDVHIKRLRKKIEIDPKHPELIVTVRGVGYKYTDD